MQTRIVSFIALLCALSACSSRKEEQAPAPTPQQQQAQAEEQKAQEKKAEQKAKEQEAAAKRDKATQLTADAGQNAKEAVQAEVEAKKDAAAAVSAQASADAKKAEAAAAASAQKAKEEATKAEIDAEVQTYQIAKNGLAKDKCNENVCNYPGFPEDRVLLDRVVNAYRAADVVARDQRLSSEQKAEAAKYAKAMRATAEEIRNTIKDTLAKLASIKTITDAAAAKLNKLEAQAWGLGHGCLLMKENLGFFCPGAEGSEIQTIKTAKAKYKRLKLNHKLVKASQDIIDAYKDVPNLVLPELKLARDRAAQLPPTFAGELELISKRMNEIPQTVWKKAVEKYKEAGITAIAPEEVTKGYAVVNSKTLDQVETMTNAGTYNLTHATNNQKELKKLAVDQIQFTKKYVSNYYTPSLAVPPLANAVREFVDPYVPEFIRYYLPSREKLEGLNPYLYHPVSGKGLVARLSVYNDVPLLYFGSLRYDLKTSSENLEREAMIKKWDELNKDVQQGETQEGPVAFEIKVSPQYLNDLVMKTTMADAIQTVESLRNARKTFKKAFELSERYNVKRLSDKERVVICDAASCPAPAEGVTQIRLDESSPTLTDTNVVEAARKLGQI